MADVVAAQQEDVREFDVPRMIQIAMDYRRVNQSELAHFLGVHQVSISRRLRGVTPFGHDELIALAAFLDVDIEFFFQAPSSVTAGRSSGRLASPCFWPIPDREEQMELALGLERPVLVSV